MCYQGASRFHIKQQGQKTLEYDAHIVKEPRHRSNWEPIQTSTTR
jgi:hypothetical protein